MLTARYATLAELAADVDSQLGRGGLLVRGAVPAGLEQFGALELEVCCGAASVVVAARVLQIFPGVGVAVSIDATGRARIGALAAAPARAPAASPDPPAEDASKGVAASMLEKIQRALKGDREARFAVLRDPNRAIHPHVLRNPGLMLEEIAAIARMTSVSVDMLKQIASRREWGHRPEIAIALVRNPTVPVPTAIELLPHVSAADLAMLAKDTRTREPVQRAARKRLLK